MNLKKSIVAAIVIGILQYIFLTFCWGYIAQYSPLVPWLVGHEVTETSMSLVVKLFDFFVNVLLSIPAAYALYKLQPRKLLLYIVLAVIPSFIWTYKFLVIKSNLITGLGLQTFLLGMIHLLLSIPIAVFIIHRISIRLTRTAATQLPIS